MGILNSCACITPQLVVACYHDQYSSPAICATNSSVHTNAKCMHFGLSYVQLFSCTYVAQYQWL